jgi:very-short-patch-repair endonuclease
VRGFEADSRDEGDVNPVTRKPPLPAAFLDAVRRLRGDCTDAEMLLWRLLRNRRLGGFKFRRQHPVGRFVLDFYCDVAKLAVELDGGGHAETGQRRRDTDRAEALAGEGIRVLRFWNNEVLDNTEGVLRAIWDALHSLTPAPSPGGRGEKKRTTKLPRHLLPPPGEGKETRSNAKRSRAFPG